LENSRIEEIKNKIKEWLVERNVWTIDEKQDSRSYFTLLVEPTKKGSVIPLFIAFPLNYIDKLMISWGLRFDEEQKKSFLALKEDVKENLARDIQTGFLLMNILLKFHPDFKNIESIHAQKLLYLDGLTKDRFSDVLVSIIMAYGYLLSQFEKYGVSRERFDPSLWI
jgi:hypothetical protein